LDSAEGRRGSQAVWSVRDAARSSIRDKFKKKSARVRLLGEIHAYFPALLSVRPNRVVESKSKTSTVSGDFREKKKRMSPLLGYRCGTSLGSESIDSSTTWNYAVCVLGEKGKPKPRSVKILTAFKLVSILYSEEIFSWL